LLEGREKMTMKPKGFWLSVDGSWEEWLKGNWENWFNGMVCLEAELSKDINLLIINKATGTKQPTQRKIFLKHSSNTRELITGQIGETVGYPRKNSTKT
jgi:hypothetical protein